MIDDVLLNLLVDARRSHTRESFFRAVNRDDPGAIVPRGQLHRTVGDDRVVLEIFSAHFDELLAHERLAADPRAENYLMACRFHLFQLLDPLLDRSLALALVVL